MGIVYHVGQWVTYVCETLLLFVVSFCYKSYDHIVLVLANSKGIQVQNVVNAFNET
jgi:hypothetical protein